MEIQAAPMAVQPNPVSDRETVQTFRVTNAARGNEPGNGLAEVQEGTSLSEVIAGLNALGVAPRDLIDILKSIKSQRGTACRILMCATQERWVSIRSRSSAIPVMIFWRKTLWMCIAPSQKCVRKGVKTVLILEGGAAIASSQVSALRDPNL